VPFRLGDRKAQRDDVEERRITGFDTPPAKMVTDREAQLVAPIGSGRPAISGASVRPSALVTAVVSGDSARRPARKARSRRRPPGAGMGVEHVGAEPAVRPRHALAVTLAASRSRVM
jgi:hypothetical protein